MLFASEIQLYGPLIVNVYPQHGQLAQMKNKPTVNSLANPLVHSTTYLLVGSLGALLHSPGGQLGVDVPHNDLPVVRPGDETVRRQRHAGQNVITVLLHAIQRVTWNSHVGQLR